MSEAIPIPHDQLGAPDLDSDKSAGYNPTSEEEKAIKLVEHLYSKAKGARKSYDDKWLSNYKMFRGKQWTEQRPSYRHSEVINLIFRSIQAQVPILMDTRPKIEYVPQEPGDLELAQILNDCLDSDWNDGNWLYKLTEIVYDSRFYGVGFGSLKYDPKAALGAGRIVFESEDTFCAYPDPYARNVNERANYFIWAEPTPLDRIKREHPDKKQYIKGDLIDLSKFDRRNISDQSRYYSAGDPRNVGDSGKDFDLESKDEALKIELYIHDDEYCEEEIAEENKDTGSHELKYVQKLKYPNGRYVSVANGVLLDNDGMPYEDKKFPYLRLVNYILPHEFWGISDIEQLEGPQKTFNKLISFVLDVLTLMGNPIWVVDTTSGVDTDNLFNRPGLAIEKEPGTEVQRVEGVQLQPYILQLIDQYKLWFDDISGSNDVSRGNRPEGVTAASAITALQDAQQTRERQRARNLDAFLQDFGKMYASRVFQFYDAPRMFRVTGNEGVSRYFKFHIEKVPTVDEAGQPTGDTKNVAKIRSFNQGADGQHYEGEEKALEIRGEFDVRVTSGSGLPFEKNRIEQQSLNLFDRQIIDAEEVLKNIKYPGAEGVMKRMAEKAAAAAQAEQEQAMQAEAQKAQMKMGVA